MHLLLSAVEVANITQEDVHMTYAWRICKLVVFFIIRKPLYITATLTRLDWRLTSLIRIDIFHMLEPDRTCLNSIVRWSPG